MLGCHSVTDTGCVNDSINVFPIVIWSEFRMGKYRDDDHREYASHVMRNIQSLILKTLSKEVTLPFIDSNTCARQVQAISQVKNLVQTWSISYGP